MKATLEELASLFEEARQKNEFEFVLVLINYRGMGTHKLTSNLYEWFEAIEFYKGLYYSLENKEKARIAALLYSTFFENSDFYNITGSLCRIKLGYKGSSYLFWKTKKLERLLGVGEKKDFVMELLFDAGKMNILKFFDEIHFKEIRNTFFHSAYALSDDDYILHDSDPIYIDNVGQYSFSIKDFFYPKVENIIEFFDQFKMLFFKHFDSYTTDKEIIGNFPHPTKITILGSEKGLQGFKIKNSVQFYGEWHDSGIWYEEEHDWFVGHNIRISSAHPETIEIQDQLKRYENKEDINKNDAEFHNLIDKVIERNQADEIARATILLVKFGKLKQEKMHKEENFFKRRSYPKYILPFYLKAIEIGSELFDTKELKKEVEELKKLISN